MSAGDGYVLEVLPGTLAVCRLGPEAAVPAWSGGGGFQAALRTGVALTIVCPQTQVPPGVQCERDWRAARVRGTLDFSLVGVLHGLLGPLAAAGVSVFALSTYETDYLLVRAADLERASAAWRDGGLRVVAGSWR